MSMTYAQMFAAITSAKLTEVAKLPDDQVRASLVQVAREVREALITLGLRTRKTRTKKPAPAVAAKKAS